MVAKKERTLLIEVQSLDAEDAPPSAALHTEMRDALRRSNIASDSVPPLYARHYSRQARLCMVCTSLAAARDVRTAIRSVRYVQAYPVRLAVVRTFGNARGARREFAARCEAALRRLADDPEAQHAVRGELKTVLELQKA
jgi:hypothetical protein